MSTARKGLLIGIDYSSELAKYRGEKVARLTRALVGASLDLPIETYIDLYYIHYLPAPIIRQDDDSVSWLSIARQLLTSDQGRRIRARTVLDSFMSVVAASLLISRVYGALANDNGARLDVDAPVQGSSVSDVDVALRETMEYIEVINDLRLVAGGLNPGSLSVASFEEYAMNVIKLARKTDVAQILRILHGLNENEIASHRRIYPSRRGMKTGYSLGSDLERIASRSIILDDDLFYFKLAEGRLLLYSKAYESSGGPVYVLVDKSGSMDGDKILWAKALSISIITKAIHRGRRILFRYFDSQPHELRSISKRIALKDISSLIDYIATMRNGGGTDITRALITAISDIKRSNLSNCTVVLITDGLDRVSGKPIRRGLMEAGSRLYTVMIKGHNDSLKAISDEYFQAVKLAREEIIKVVKAID